jgi:acylphosphatase
MAEPNRVRRRVRVHGQVQGVFFRDSTRERAQAAGVAGWVRNCSDGSVEAVFEGDESAIDEMLEFSRGGPQSAQVRRVEVSAEKPEGLSEFEVR